MELSNIADATIVIVQVIFARLLSRYATSVAGYKATKVLRG